jgi:hypothetical protein
MTKKVITNQRTKNALHNQFKDFLDGENIEGQINKKIEEHSIKKGKIIEFYQYLDMALVELSGGKQVEAYILHRCYGGIVDLFTPLGEEAFSETKHEPCIIPRFYQEVLVAEVGADEYVVLGYFNLQERMEGSFSPAKSNEYIIKSLSDTNQGGLSVTPSNINISSANDITFTQSDVGKATDIKYANSKNTYTKDKVYNKEQVDLMIKEIWDYIDPTHEESD